MTSKLDLKDLQEWMSILIQHSQDSAAGARTKAARSIAPVAEVNSGGVVLPNDRMSVYERLDVYNNGYFGRLREVLESDFPALVHALGEDAWFHLALSFLARHPSEHPNLNVLNRKLPDYIAKKNLPHRVFLRDLAQLEVHLTEAFDAPPFEPFDMQRLAGLTPEQWENTVFTPNPSLRLLESSYAVNRYLQSVFDEDPLPPVKTEAQARRKSFLAIYRKDYRVWRLDLPRAMFLILRALTEGEPLSTAIQAGGDHSEDFQHWFREWSGDGLFVDVRVRAD